jgi:endonuclease/exonuclease/phosphatase family metal-dependent hydrolase
MMIIASWNIQNGKGTDNVTSLQRIANVINAMGDPDVICLQEVSRHLPLAGKVEAPDQVAQISELFPSYETMFGVALESSARRGESRWQFGNVTLTRLPVLSVFHHPLPQPATTGIKHMPRQAIELTVMAPQGALRIINTHLEFHSALQRSAQIRRLRGIHQETVTNAATPPAFDPIGPYQFVNRPVDCVMCGDFNMGVDFPEYAAMLAPLHLAHASLLDAWPVVHGLQSHDPTCGVYDHEQWPQGPHCRDFFFVNEGLASMVRELRVDTKTNASDHQPLMLELADD